ncbi:MAG: LysM peptidoglycan-binding domain-containing protein [Sphingobacteriales bacterium]|nr:MAG: LysM peptidoglycan-binding domain-containing protein [Sphingobacteriales bacterium]
MKKTIVSLAAFFVMAFAHAQRMTPDEYIATYKDAAIAQMKRLGVPASIILAQGLLETESGNSDLVKRSNNHFGIKCKSTWTGESVRHTDDAPNECFRKYASAMDSYKDHSDYLYSNARYASLFKLESTDYKGWAHGLKRAGYATNPRYPQILISNIEKYNLQQFNEPSDGMRTVPEDVAVMKESKAVEESPKTIATATEKKDGNLFQKLFSSKKNKSNQLFNRLKAVMAFKGTSLLAIATENNIALAKLLEFNDLTVDGLLKEDQWIYLERKHKEGNRDSYTALQNESLYDVSQVNAVQLAMLAQYNGIEPNSMIKTGDIVRLRPGGSMIQAATKTAAAKMHEVQAKEGLYGIAKKYNVSVDELKEWNNLPGNDLKPGQQLIIAK